MQKSEGYRKKHHEEGSLKGKELRNIVNFSEEELEKRWSALRDRDDWDENLENLPKWPFLGFRDQFFKRRRKGLNFIFKAWIHFLWLFFL